MSVESIDKEKVKSALGGQVLLVTPEEHKYILQCMLKKVHDALDDKKHCGELALAMLQYTWGVGTMRTGDGVANASLETMQSIAAVRTMFKDREILRNLMAHPDYNIKWFAWATLFKQVINGSTFEEDILQFMNSDRKMDFAHVELPD